MSAIEEFRERYELAKRGEENDEMRKRRLCLDLIRDIEMALRNAPDNERQDLHDLKVEVGVEVFGLNPAVMLANQALKDDESDESDEPVEDPAVILEREHEANLAKSAQLTAEADRVAASWAASRAASDAERAVHSAKRAKTDLLSNVLFGAFVLIVLFGTLFTFWFFLHGPSASEQLEDQFRQACIDKGWTYDVETNNDDDIGGTAHGDCVAP